MVSNSLNGRAIMSGFERFQKNIRRVKISEGAYVNNPKDPGGETKFGISKRAYPHLDIKNLTQEQADQIYYSDFWLAMHCDSMKAGMDGFVLDFAINSGVPTVTKCLQRALGVLDDGKIGPMTDAAIRTANPRRVVRLLFVSRAIIMAEAKKSNYEEHKHGWFARLFDETMAFATECPP